MTLEEKIRDVLARLSTLSEAKASNLEPRTSHGASDSRAPAGVAERRRIQPTDPDRPPPKERSLYDWYRWKFDHTDPEDQDQLLRLWLGAERDYHTRVLNFADDRRGSLELAQRRRSIRAGLHVKREDEGADDAPSWPAPMPNRRYAEEVNPGTADEEEAARQVVEIYEGQPAEEAAYFENVTVAVIHKARKIHKRNTDDGRPRPPFLDWKDDERQRQVNLLLHQAKQRSEILGAKAIAKHFGVDKNTVKRYLEPERVAA